MDRRSFLILAGTATLAQMVQAKAITARDAIMNAELRQPYLTDLAKRTIPPSFSRYVSRFVYDHEANDVRADMATTKANALCQNPSQFPELAKDVAACAEEKQKVELIEKYAYELRQYPFEDFHSLTSINGVPQEIYNCHLSSTVYLFPRPFSTHMRGDWFDDSFKRFMIKQNFEPTQEFIASILWHECQHAKHYFDGLKLSNGLEVTTKALSESVAKYVDECESYFKTFDFIKHLGDKDPTYHETFISASRFLTTYRKHLKVEKDLDHEALEHEDKMIRLKRQEFPLMDALYTFYIE